MKKAVLTKWLAKGGYIKSSLVKEAFLHIDRTEFVREDVRGEAHENIPLPIGFGRMMPQPLTTAFMLELLEPKLGEKILHAGAGTGWQTALLAYIVGGKAESELPSSRHRSRLSPRGASCSL